MAITIYGTAADADSYMEARGSSVWAAASDDDKLAARFRGSVYIDGTYGYRFTGSPTNGIDQDRQWPRKDAVTYYGDSISSSVVPRQVVYASYEAALLEVTTPGSLASITSENERLKRIKAGSVEVEYADSSSDSAIAGAAPMSSIIEGLLMPFIGTVEPLPGILVV